MVRLGALMALFHFIFFPSSSFKSKWNLPETFRTTISALSTEKILDEASTLVDSVHNIQYRGGIPSSNTNCK